MATTVATLAGASTGLTDDALEELQAQLRGLVLRPSDPGHADVRGVFNAMHHGTPAFTVRCSGTVDVLDAVNFARENDLLVAIRGGGHSIAGLSVGDGAMLIDLSAMNAVHVDPQRRLAHVQGGALWGDVDRETQAFGLAVPGGAVSDTGVAGLTLGGGYGYLRRRYGLSSDNLVEAEVVCADGQVRIASADSHPDLFWALRGGGGNFGVVTSFTFRLHPVGPTIAASDVFYAVEDAAEVLRNWRSFTEQAPDEVSSEALAITLPAMPELPEVLHERAVLAVAGVHCGADVDTGMSELAALGTLGTPLVEAAEPRPYVILQSEFDALFPRGELQCYWKSQYLTGLPDAAIDVLAELAATRPAPITLVNLLHMGGAIAAVAPEETAFPERTAPYMVSFDGIWDDPAANAANIAWIRSAWERMTEFGTGSVYLNFSGGESAASDVATDSAYGRNARRLAEVKAGYDPSNLFRLNNNIRPAA